MHKTILDIAMKGIGIEKNEIEAVKWYKLSAEQGFDSTKQYWMLL